MRENEMLGKQQRQEKSRVKEVSVRLETHRSHEAVEVLQVVKLQNQLALVPSGRDIDAHPRLKVLAEFGLKIVYVRIAIG
jgi:hypothetical protein